MKFAIIVPARIASTRFPKKLLHEVHGKPVLLRTAGRIRAEAPEFPLHFAVDNEKLRRLLVDAGYSAMMTDPGHTCGTDRIAEANRTIGAEHVINGQADEPLVSGGQIRALARLIEGDALMATLGRPVRYEKEYLNPNHVKLVCDGLGHALYFSRAPSRTSATPTASSTPTRPGAAECSSTWACNARRGGGGYAGGGPLRPYGTLADGALRGGARDPAGGHLVQSRLRQCLTKEYEPMACMGRIGVDQVLEAVLRRAVPATPVVPHPRGPSPVRGATWTSVS
jgi:hypothetical protein